MNGTFLFSKTHMYSVVDGRTSASTRLPVTYVRIFTVF